MPQGVLVREGCPHNARQDAMGKRLVKLDIFGEATSADSCRYAHAGWLLDELPDINNDIIELGVAAQRLSHLSF